MNADPTLQSLTQRLGEPALARCFELATKQPNHLHTAASRLSSARRYEFFLACYAAMRALDDLVDCEFLGGDVAAREELRPVMMQRLAQWEAQVEAAARGGYTAHEDDFEPRVFEALNEFLSRSDLGAVPFARLAASLRRDLEERSLRSWEDFLEYCEGAAVAPGAIFLYLLAADEDAEGGFRYPRADQILDEARDLAHYCYLTHIVRDLAVDASRDAQLLTIPEDWLHEAGFRRDAFRLAAAAEKPTVAPLARRLLEEAEAAGARAQIGLLGFAEDLSVAHRSILDYLFGLYREAHARAAERWL